MNFDLDVNKVVNDMLQASAGELIKGGKKASEYASHEYASFISNIQHVQTMGEKGIISAAEAQALVDQHKLSMQAVLLAVEGLGVIGVQNAINAALGVLSQALAATLGTAFKSLKFSLV